MEIKKVVNEVKNEYPKINQVSKKHLKSSIPNKWLQIGISSLVIATIMQNNVYADYGPPYYVSEKNVPPGLVDIGGAYPTNIFPMIGDFVIKISIITFIITGLKILTTKIKSKKQNETKKVKIWIKIIFIMSIISILIIFFMKLYDFDLYLYNCYLKIWKDHIISSL